MKRRDKNKEKIEYLKRLEKAWLDTVVDEVIENANDLNKLNSQSIWKTVGKIQAARAVLR